MDRSEADNRRAVCESLDVVERAYRGGFLDTRRVLDDSQTVVEEYQKQATE